MKNKKKKIIYCKLQNIYSFNYDKNYKNINESGAEDNVSVCQLQWKFSQ